MTTVKRDIVRGVGLAGSVVLLVLTSFGQAKIGTTAAQFLGIPAGPRAVAMGGAYVAANNDVTSLYWNPGAIGFIPRSQVTFSSTKWLAGTDYRWAGAVFSFDAVNFIGLSLTNLDYGE